MKFALPLLLALLSCVATLAEDKPVTPSNTVTAFRRFKLLAQAPIRLEKARALLEGQPPLSEAQAAAAEAVGLDSKVDILVFTANAERHEYVLRVNLDQPQAAGAKMQASEAANKALAVLQQAINSDADDSVRRRVQDLNVTKSTLMLKSNRLRDDIAKLQMELSKQGSPDAVHQLLYSLQSQSETVKIDKAAKQARMDALAEQVAKLSKEIEGKIKDDPIAAELQKVVEARIVDLKRKQDNPSAFSKTEVDEAMGPVAEARAKLLERREVATNAAGGDTIAGWNRDMMNLSVDLAELDARGKVLADRLDEYRTLGGELDYKLFQLQQSQSALAGTDKQLDEINRQINEADLAFRQQQVSINVTLSQDTPAPTTQSDRTTAK